jgi:MFS family permease
MAQGISEVLTYAIGVAITASAIIAVIRMLFSSRAKVNGLMFLLGWAVALAAVSGVAYVISDAGNASTSTTAADTVSWAQIVFGVLFLLLAGRSWRNRPEPQRGRDDGAVPGLRRGPHRQGHPAVDRMRRPYP